MGKIKIKTVDLVTGIIISVIFIIFSFSGFTVFESLEKIIYGVEMRFSLPPGMGENRIAIVNIDEKSLRQLGPWPWPRSSIAEMITILKGNGARLIAVDLPFNENEQNQGLDEVRQLQTMIREKDKGYSEAPWLIDALDEIERRLDNDAVLVQSVKGSNNTVLPVIGKFGMFNSELVLTNDSVLNENSIRSRALQSGIKDIIPVRELITPFEELAQVSKGLGHINLSPNRSMEGRKHLLFFNFRGHVIPSMPLKIILDYLNLFPNDSVISKNGIKLPDFYIPFSKGEVLIKYVGGRRSFPYYSFVDIHKVRNVPAVFDDKIVLLGYTADGGPSVNTPVDQKMPRVEFIANIIDGLMRGRYLKRPALMGIIEAVFLLLAVMISSSTLSNVKFINRTGITIGVIFFVIIVGVISFVSLDVWFKTVYICLAMVTVYLVYSARDIILSQRALGLSSKESIETNRMLGLSFQSQGLLDLAYEKFRKCPLDDSMRDVVYNLGLDYERKRMINKAISVYEYITENDSEFRDLKVRIAKLKKTLGALAETRARGSKEDKIFVDDDLEIKPTVGRYEIIKELGQGAMGVVYLAKDPNINRLLAIKTIRFSDEFEADRIEGIKNRFFAEAEIAGKLSHPSIVSIYDAGEDFDLTYLAMEYLTGGDLRDPINKGILFPLRKVLYILKETAVALDYAHSQGVIHRDIKPGNIMLLKNGKVKVTDFGIAKAMSSSQTKSGVVLGTPNYMSPEQINGQKIDGRSDIFALGVVMFELLTGQLPFRGDNITNLLYQITQIKHPSVKELNPKIPKVCEQIIDKALAKDPTKRFHRAGDMAKYLKALLSRLDQAKSKSNSKKNAD
ncbi:CHASE2 domain-containing protein [Thermodesulfobacteriota bacterium]